MKKTFHFIIICFITMICKTNAQSNNNFDWLVGTWKINNAKGSIIEIWKKQNDSVYIGFSGFVKGKDTIVEETIELKKVDAAWFYIPTTLNQNNKKPVLFKLIFNKDKEFICENKEHDFPQRINYRLVGTATLFASIEGKTKDKYRKINYDYAKEN